MCTCTTIFSLGFGLWSIIYIYPTVRTTCTSKEFTSNERANSLPKTFLKTSIELSQFNKSPIPSSYYFVNLLKQFKSLYFCHHKVSGTFAECLHQKKKRMGTVPSGGEVQLQHRICISPSNRRRVTTSHLHTTLTLLAALIRHLSSQTLVNPVLPTLMSQHSTKYEGSY